MMKHSDTWHCALWPFLAIKKLGNKNHTNAKPNADGSGYMLAIRIPSCELAMMAYESLKVIRDR